MINLQIKDYCNDCPDFEVNQETVTLNSIGFCETVHILTCEHAEKCENLYRHLKKE